MVLVFSILMYGSIVSLAYSPPLDKFPYKSETRHSDKNINTFLELIEQRILHEWQNYNII